MRQVTYSTRWTRSTSVLLLCAALIGLMPSRTLHAQPPSCPDVKPATTGPEGKVDPCEPSPVIMTPVRLAAVNSGGDVVGETYGMIYRPNYDQRYNTGVILLHDTSDTYSTPLLRAHAWILASRQVLTLIVNLRRSPVSPSDSGRPEDNTEDIRAAIRYMLGAEEITSVLLAGDRSGAKAAATYEKTMKEETNIVGLGLFQVIADPPPANDPEYLPPPGSPDTSDWRRVPSEKTYQFLVTYGQDSGEHPLYELIANYSRPMLFLYAKPDTYAAEQDRALERAARLPPSSASSRISGDTRCILGEEPPWIDFYDSVVEHSVFFFQNLPGVRIENSPGRLRSRYRTSPVLLGVPKADMPDEIEYFDALLYTPRADVLGFSTNNMVHLKNVGILLNHGAVNSFYNGVPGWLGPSLATQGYTALALNRHDSGGAFYAARFEDGVRDLAAGVQRLQDLGCGAIFLQGHSLGSVYAVDYLAQTEDPRVKGLILTGAVADYPRWRRHWMGCNPDDRWTEYWKAVLEAQSILSGGRAVEEAASAAAVTIQRPVPTVTAPFISRQGPPSPSGAALPPAAAVPPRSEAQPQAAAAPPPQTPTPPPTACPDASAAAEAERLEGLLGGLLYVPWWSQDGDASEFKIPPPQTAESFLSFFGPDARTRPIQSVAPLRVPMLLIHGDEDKRTWWEDELAIACHALASPDVTVVLQAGDHGFVRNHLAQPQIEAASTIGSWLDIQLNLADGPRLATGIDPYRAILQPLTARYLVSYEPNGVRILVDCPGPLEG